MFSKKEPKDKEAQKQEKHQPESHQSPSVYLVNDAIEDFAKRGGFDDLAGMGKPLKVPEGDALSGVLKNANYLPPWVELRKEIAEEMKLLIHKMNHINPGEVEIEIELLNEKIKNYNKKVPNPVLQKGFVSEQTLEIKYENHWR
ncbi:DUF1992 domain-containing protein [Paenibacillus polygoni]|uniref:DUF1992 domain-containing protein n=1 Tax=Paenibacillus polygoni TaxID=3050112 RepID=A0ABY8WYZ8_9BACL|nr:DUF1992 domain-containing protein [Paenibacillus polygoni]WIV18365.1 DUF1992 domain-containing protein [Paenibacillus polygoni]